MRWMKMGRDGDGDGDRMEQNGDVSRVFRVFRVFLFELYKW